MHIVNIIGMSARRVSNPNINKTEQNTSPYIASIKEISLQWIRKCQCHLPEIVNLGQSVHNKKQAE